MFKLYRQKNGGTNALNEFTKFILEIVTFLFIRDWISVQEKIREHAEFDRWFVEYPEDTTWMEANLFDGDTTEDRYDLVIVYLTISVCLSLIIILL